MKDIESIKVQKIRNQIDRRIQALASDPYPHGCKPLEGKWAGMTRVRSGDFRIVYQVIDDRLIVMVVKVSDRGDVYRMG